MQSLRERIGPLQAPIGVRAMFAILLALGVATFAIEVRSDPTRAYAAFLLAYWFFMGLGLGGAFFTALHYLVGATWSVVVRRVAEAFSSYLPMAFLLLLVLLLGIPHLYVWSTRAMAEPGHALDPWKGHYLTTSFFTIRTAGILALWCLFSEDFVRNPIR